MNMNKWWFKLQLQQLPLSGKRNDRRTKNSQLSLNDMNTFPKGAIFKVAVLPSME